MNTRCPHHVACYKTHFTMKFELTKYHRNTPENELIDDLIRVSKLISKDTVTRAEYEEHGNFNSTTLLRRFGSWFDVLERADLQDSRSRLNISEEELFKNLETVWISLGRQPKSTEMKPPLSAYSANTYLRRFGSWMKGLQSFVEYVNEEAYDEFSKDESIQPILAENSEEKIVHKTKREISDRLRFRILMRDGFTCRSCGKSPLKERGVELHVDHILPWSKGGETLPENLEAKCQQCNFGKGNAFDA
jgi:hypothetical protein